MSKFFRAVAIDYDGTLTHHPRPGAAVREALRAVKEAGWFRDVFVDVPIGGQLEVIEDDCVAGRIDSQEAASRMVDALRARYLVPSA